MFMASLVQFFVGWFNYCWDILQSLSVYCSLCVERRDNSMGGVAPRGKMSLLRAPRNRFTVVELSGQGGVNGNLESLEQLGPHLARDERRMHNRLWK